MKEGEASQTAEIVCLFRALDNHWLADGSVLNDKYAQHFLTGKFKRRFQIFSKAASKPVFQKLSLGLYDWIILRHAYIDKLARQLSKSHHLILLGAGFDSRALRLADIFSGRLIEIDFPATQLEKKKRLAATSQDLSRIEFFNADFTKNNLADILKPIQLENEKALIVWEGVSMYVPEEVIRKTITTVSEYFSPESILVVDYWKLNAKSIIEAQINKVMPALMKVFFNEPFLFGSDKENLEKLSLESGAKTFLSLSAEEIAKECNVAKFENFKSSALAVLGF